MKSPDRMRLVVVGNGMVGHRLLTTLVELGAAVSLDITVLGEETRAAYDRVALSSLFAGSTPEDLSLVEPDFFDRHGIDCRLGDPVERIDRVGRTVHTASGAALSFDRLVLATGSFPFVPPVEGSDGPGCHVYRTIDDLAAIRSSATAPGVTTGVVVGGGLLGLEAANALHNLGLETHVVEFAPRLMPVQLDEGGGRALRSRIESIGIRVHLGRRTLAVEHAADHPVALRFDGHDPLPVDLVVFSAGIRPRDALARDCGLEIAERGGVAVDRRMRTSDPDVLAIGEVAAFDGRTFGLVAPGYQMARVAAEHLAAEVGCLDRSGVSEFRAVDLSTKLKLLGVAVASIGDVHGGDDRTPLVWDDPVSGVYQRLDVDDEGRVVSAVLVGEADAYGRILDHFRRTCPVDDPANLLRPMGGDTPEVGRDTGVCSCENVSRGALLDAVGGGCSSLDDLRSCTGAGTGCGGCVPELEQLLRSELARRGEAIPDRLCVDIPMSRSELFEVVRIRGYRTFAEILAGVGEGRGCEVCRPTVASILSSLGGGHILDGEQAALQDSNDHFLANLQRDGTYSVVPRVPGGEITPEKLIVLGEVARDFGLYTKITGGQRIDLLGARVEQLPAIWRVLVDAGFESGHAYGKSMRTVKSCVGSTWCRYGVQDSTTMAILLEERYRGLRSPHKIKLAVSGCARECAEARSKDVGVIATERGWNLYVGGNGGTRPRHADLLAEDLDDRTLVLYIDRFLMYYVRTAERLERTSTWIERMDGGLGHVRDVVIEDRLGVAEELEAQMAAHVDSYECEWKATLEDPQRLRRFVSFVNAPALEDPTVVMVPQRGQHRPQLPDERRAAINGSPR